MATRRSADAVWSARTAVAAALAVGLAALLPGVARAGPQPGLEDVDTVAGQAQPAPDPLGTGQQPFGLTVRARAACGPPINSPVPAASGSPGFAFPACDLLLIADPVNHVVRQLAAGDGGTVETVVAGNAGSGVENGAGATSSQLTGPYAVSADAGGLYIADTFANQVRFVDPGGGMHLLAGSAAGDPGFAGDGGPAADALLDQPFGVARDAGRGVTYVADTLNDRVRAIAADGTITTVVGTGARGFAGDGGPGTACELDRPRGLAVEAGGGLLIADTGNSAIRRYDPDTRVVTTIAGTGSAGFSGDGGPARAARLAEPAAVAVSPTGGALYIADTDNHRVRRVSGTVIDTVAGTGEPGAGADGTVATAARLQFPFAVAVLSDGRLVVGDTGSDLVRAVDGGRIFTLAGDGTPSFGPEQDQLALPSGAISPLEPRALPGVFCESGEGPSGPATLVLDTFNQALRGQCTIGDAGLFDVLGDGRPGNGPDGPIGTEGPPARLAYPMGLAAGGPRGDIFVADTFNNVVRAVDPNPGALSVGTVVGTGKPGFAGDGGPATQAELDHPEGVAVDAAGDLYIADTYNDRVRRVDARTGAIATIAGTGVSGGGGDAGPAVDATLFFPAGVAVDTASPANVYVTDTFSHRVRRIDGTTGIITTIGGSGEAGFADGPAASARFDRPWGIAVDSTPGPEGPVVFVTDERDQRVRTIAAGTVGTLAGTGVRGLLGDPGPAETARVNGPRGVTVLDSSGALLLADTFNSRVRRLGVGALAPGDVDLGSVLVGDRGRRTFLAANTGTGLLDVRAVAIGGSAAFSLEPATSSGDCRAVGVLRPNGACSLAVDFTPSATGRQTGAVTFARRSGGARQLLASLGGTGVEPSVRLILDQAPIASEAEVDFEGDVTRTLGIEDTGTAPLHVTGIAVTGSAAFTVVPSATSPACPTPRATVPVGGRCNLDIRFTGDTATATLTMRTDDAPAGSTNEVSLRLVGTQPPIR